MEALPVNSELVGAKVRCAARPEWGTGTVLRVQAAQVGGRRAHRVSVQFSVGHRTLIVPPARLAAPIPEPQRQAGWLEGVGRTALDDRLRALPESVIDVLGSPRTRLAAVMPLYEISEESESLLSWARRQTGVGDPLSRWSRDELLAALRDFNVERDAHLRNLAAVIKLKEGPQALRDLLTEMPGPIAEAALIALRRLI